MVGTYGKINDESEAKHQPKDDNEPVAKVSSFLYTASGNRRLNPLISASDK